MESIRAIYRMGLGPSSSHTMGPRKAAQIFSAQNPAPDHYEVTLYGSLAATGKGHLTDKAILDVLSPIAPTRIHWKPETFLDFHPNGMLFEAFSPEGKKTGSWTIFSVGGAVRWPMKNKCRKTIHRFILTPRSKRYKNSARSTDFPSGNTYSSTRGRTSGNI